MDVHTMTRSWVLVALTAIGAICAGWFHDDPLQVCRSYGSVKTLEDLSLCMQRFVVPEGAISAAEWHNGTGFIPTSQQRRDLNKLVRRMASASSVMTCKRLLLPDSLKVVYHPPAVFRDVKLRESVCVLLERTHRGRFVAGWGWLVIRAAPVEDDEKERGSTVLNNVNEQEEKDQLQHQQQLGPISWVSISHWRWRWDSKWIGNRGSGGEAQDQVDDDEGAAGKSTAEEETGAFHSSWTPRGKRPLWRLHLGVPHPSFEGPVDLQAVALFRRLPSLARSVVVSGKHRHATSVDSACLPGLSYPASDPSHNDRDAFNVISFALLELEKEELGQHCGAGTGEGSSGGGGGSSGGGEEFGWQGRAMFLQLHGKAQESCPGSTVFASGGFGHNATAFYGRSNTAVARVVAALKDATATAVLLDAGNDGEGDVDRWAIRTPLDDLSCILTATRNVFGRVVNAVARADACTRPADESGGGGHAGGGGTDCFGAFVHVEQADVAREPEAWHVWMKALNALQSSSRRAKGVRNFITLGR